MMSSRYKLLFIMVIFVRIKPCVNVAWNKLECSTDGDESVPEGRVADMGRFPWLGVVQHSFYLSGKVQFAVTGAVLVHTNYAIASADDMAKIQPDQLSNNTKMIVWANAQTRYGLDVKDYVLHPQYQSMETFATIALLELTTWGATGDGEVKFPVLPVCLPLYGAGIFTDIYAVRMTDYSSEIVKEVNKMKFMDTEQCDEFYYKAQLMYNKTNPVFPICAVSEYQKHPCVWDSGIALVTRQNWGHWKLIGFGLRGPGCGVPARFLNIHDFMPWINDVISEKPLEDFTNTYKFGLRRISPIKLIMYKAEVQVPRKQGQCNRRERGGVLFKDTTELSTDKNFVQGFYWVAVYQIAEFLCAEVNLEANSRTNAAVWLEHHCHKEFAGLAMDHKGLYPDYRRLECFYYFKSVAFVEFRFFFSFTAMLEVTLYGKEEAKRIIPNPFKSTIYTTSWYPTKGLLQFGSFRSASWFGSLGFIDFK